MCAECERLTVELERQKARFNAALVDLDNAQADLVAKRREASRLKNRIASLTAPPSGSESRSRRVYDHYVSRTGKRIAFGPKRQKVLAKAFTLPAMTEERMCRAIDGYLCGHPEALRWRAKGLPVELEYICRDEVTLERGLKWAGVTL